MKTGSFGQGGFTLVELMVTVGVIGILVMISLPDVININRFGFKNDKATVRDALYMARALASSQKQCARVRIQDNKNLVVTAHAAQPFGPPCDDPLSVAQPGGTTFTLSATTMISLNFSNGSQDLVFLPSGGLRDNDTVTNQLNATDGSRANVVVYPAIGQIRVQ